jgi:hypothetical protein
LDYIKIYVVLTSSKNDRQQMSETSARADDIRRAKERKTKSWMDEGNPEFNGRGRS